jgi:hypothetical protein
MAKSEAKRQGKRRVGRPSTFDQAKADYILAEMMERGRLLVDICGDPGMPSRSAAYRWLVERPEFGRLADRAREAIADHSVAKADNLVEQTKPETATADRIRLIHYHWRASRMAPHRYSEKRTTELTGKDGGPVQIEEHPAVLDASQMPSEERQALRRILLAAKVEAGSTGGER